MFAAALAIFQRFSALFPAIFATLSKWEFAFWSRIWPFLFQIPNARQSRLPFFVPFIRAARRTRAEIADRQLRGAPTIAYPTEKERGFYKDSPCGGVSLAVMLATHHLSSYHLQRNSDRNFRLFANIASFPHHSEMPFPEIRFRRAFVDVFVSLSLDNWI